MSFLGSKPNPLQNLPIGAQRTIRTLWNHYREREKQFRANPPSSLSDEPHELTDEEWQRDYERREREREWSRQARALVEEHLAPLATNEEAALALADMLPPGFGAKPPSASKPPPTSLL